MSGKILLFVMALLFANVLHAQQFSISGTVKDGQAGTPLSGAGVLLRSTTDSALVRNMISDSTGRFQFQALQADSFLLTISFVGYKEVTRGLRLDSANIHLDSTGLGGVDVNIAMAPSASSDLATVIVVAKTPLARQKEDTLEFNASQIKVNPDATAEDLARKVPGITIQNGQVQANGETIQKVTIDGRELFGDDATAALRNLPAEIIDKIQVFDRLSDQAQFTGFDDGNSTKGINIVTKAAMRNGQFGRVYAGYGTDERYSAGGNATLLHENRRISIVGNFNNINQQNFSQQDLLGVTSNAQRGGGGGGTRGGFGGGTRGQGGNQGGGNAGGFGSNANFLVGQQAGINRTNAFGMNYSDNWGKKLIVTGSYFFNNTANTTNETSSRQYFLTKVPNLNQTTLATSHNTNNRVNLRLEWRLDSANQIIITPSLSFQANSTDRVATTQSLYSTGQNVSATTNTTNSTRSGNNLNNSILYRHSFAKRGRTFSVNLNSSSNKRDGDVYVNSFQRQYDSLNNPIDTTTNRYTDQVSSGYQLSANFVYTEPISKLSQLQVNYNPTYSNSKADQQAYRLNPIGETYSIFDTSLSNRFNTVTKTQNAGITYRIGNRDNMVSFGANYQHNTITSDQDFPQSFQVNKSFNNVLPNAMVRLKLSSRSTVRLFYRSTTNNPSVTQLSNVVDITNRPFITAGNPDLKQQFTNVVSGRYTYTNTAKSLLVVGNIFYQSASDYITNSTFVNAGTRDTTVLNRITLQPGEQLTVPVNLNGYSSLRTFVTLAFPVSFIKSNFNLNGGVTFSKLPGIINNVSNLSKTTTYTAGAVIASNVSQYVDFTVSYTANFNTVKNALQAQLNDNYFQHIAGVQLNLLSKSGWFFQNDLQNQLYNGLTAGYNQSYTLWNMSAGKKFLKNQKGELKLTVFDLLRQNQSITRNVTETYIEDVQNQVLRQYFLLQFTYNLRNFGVAAARSFNRGNNNGGGFGGPPRF